MTETFQHSGIILSYHTYGSGNECVLAFHGFGQDGSEYESIGQFSSETHTLYSLDLFYHGDTVLPVEISSFSKRELKSFFEAFISHLKLTKFSLLGYSMGGRCALFLLECFPQQINHLYLLAPDGLSVNFWNRLVTSTRFGRNLYFFATRQPGLVYRISKFGQKLKLFPPTMDRFLDVNFKNEKMRSKIFKVWMLYKNIKFSQKSLAQLILQNKIKTKVFVGHKDPVVKFKLCNGFVHQLGDHGEIHLIKAGHDLFRPHVIIYLKDNLFK